MSDWQLAIEDRWAINDLLARYCFSVDQGAGDRYAELFTDDGEFSGLLAEPFRGREQLHGLAVHSHSSSLGTNRHQITNILLGPGSDPNEVVMRGYGLITGWARGGRLVYFANYRMRLIKVSGNWRIRHVHADGLPGYIDALPMDGVRNLD